MTDKRSLVVRILYRYRVFGKALLAVCKRWLPRCVSRPLLSMAERLAFTLTPDYQADTLPPIFNYWSNRYVRPKLEALGYHSPEDFFLQAAIAQAERRLPQDVLRVLSLGSGAAHMELRLLRELLQRNIRATVECVDLNPRLKAMAETEARALGVSDHFRFSTRDCNKPVVGASFDVIIVNQFFHHVEDLATFCESIDRQLDANGIVVTSDVVGRNGHVLWPTVNARVQAWWRKLPESKRFDRYFGSIQSSYRAVDHSAYSNEGVQAQGVVSALQHQFDFELFLTYGAVVMPFVERRIGFNFSPESTADIVFMDSVAADDEVGVAEHKYPASNMMALLRRKGCVREGQFLPVSPEEHIRMTLHEQELASTGVAPERG